MPIHGRGPQVVLEGYARTVARGGAGKTMRENIQAMDQLVIAGQVADGNTVDGTSRNGGQPYDVVVAQFPHETLQAYEIPAPLLQGLGGGHSDPNNIKDWGAIVDGQSHPLSQRYSTLAAAQAVFPHATSLNDEIDWCAIQAAVNALETVIYIPGRAIINRPVVSTALAPLTILGDGVNVSALVQTTAGQDGWQHTSTLSFQLFGMTLSCNGVGGTALNLDFGLAAVAQFTLRDVYIVGNLVGTSGGQLSNFWHAGIKCHNPSITVLDHIWIVGTNGGNLSTIGDAIYFTPRSNGSFNILVRDSRIHYYQRGVVFDSSGAAINLQGMVLDWVNYGGLQQFVSVIGSCLELVVTKCQGASYGAVISADGANDVVVRDGLFFLQDPKTFGIIAGAQSWQQLPQDGFWINGDTVVGPGGGASWWIKDNLFLIQAGSLTNYLFNFVNSFQRAILRDNEVYIQTGGALVGFVSIDATSTGVLESGTIFANWNNAWPKWTNLNTDNAAGGNMARFNLLVASDVPSSVQWSAQGSVIGWSYGTLGNTAFINSRGLGSGGFNWFVTDSSSVATPVQVARLDANANLTLSGPGTAGLSLVLDLPTPNTRALAMHTGGAARWIVSATNAAETGSDAGSDFVIGRYTDAGASAGSPIAISRATGLVSVSSLGFSAFPVNAANDAAAAIAGVAVGATYRNGSVMMVRVV